ncbi:MAG: nicotinate-nucleotide adenylyltransferase [Candidatus Metalachnospira sp.]|nr:nicotinate-nucleotide adenylyltransferase [Candidatus Metalachnospira sp.]
MESFICTAVTSDGCPVAVCGLCADGSEKLCIEAFSALNSIDFGAYTSGFTIDYRLGMAIKECVEKLTVDILLLGASVYVENAECSTGGIFGVPDGEFVSSEEIIINEDNFVVGFKPGKGAFGAFIKDENARKKMADRFESCFDGGISAGSFYGELLDVSDKFIIMTDGSGEGVSGIVANEKDFVTLEEVKKRFEEQTEYFGIKKIGVMGGTFDPVHNGHLIAAQTVCDKLQLDRVIFIPTGNTTYKEIDNVSSGEDRYRMTSLAVESNEMFCVSSIEIDKVGVSYTVDTIEELRKHCDSDAEIYFILGADVIQAISGWKGFDRLSKMCEFVAVTRPGYSNKEICSFNSLKNCNAKIHFLEVPALDISSSYIRTAVREGISVKYLLPEVVDKYIGLHRLYKSCKTLGRKEDTELDRILKLIY